MASIDPLRLALSDLAPEKRRIWEARIADVVACPDNESIPRVKDAGRIVDGVMVMHNGVQIAPLSYCGYPMLKMLMANRGVHEPQEERVFQEVVRILPAGSVMVELGSYWGFYSLWFTAVVPRARCYLVEPDPVCLEAGIENFRLNSAHGDFVQARVGETSSVGKNGLRTICVDDYVAEKGIQFVHVLHADIQGKELEMLRGASSFLDQQKVAYVFVSTHSNELHDACRSFLSQRGFAQIASANVDETYSYDGILVMKNTSFPGKVEVSISHRPRPNEMCPRVRC